MKKTLFVLFLFFLSFKTALAQGVAVEAFVDKPTVDLDDQIILTVRVKGANVFTEPRIPSRGNFDVLSRGSASNVELINGRLNVLKEYTYILGPKKEGAFEIGPISCVGTAGIGPMSITGLVATEHPEGRRARGRCCLGAPTGCGLSQVHGLKHETGES